ncbi:MAG TPA: type I phosphomannose isomerase catalytic subunit [Candidatus Sulfotelmatobacter sp.]|nr:type I phosphomannose isomerase catalytic subunit [Candidatus Sulfotelmatobacter sp.]
MEAVSDRVYPYVLEPKEAPAIWGGDALVRVYGKPPDPGVLLGESWECWDANRIANGPLAQHTVADLRAELGATLCGPIDAHGIFPVLTKIIDAHEALSVQVHPDDAYARRVEHQANGKTECWYILACEPGAELVLGWTRDTTRAEYERRVADGTLGDILRRVPVAPGEAYYLPAGTLHAIGAGIQLFETQQASDLTYRIFDWNRLGTDGKPRQLHVSKAGDVLDFRATFPGAVEQLTFTTDGLDRTLLIADSRFVVERVRLGAATGLALEGRPVTLTACAEPLRVQVDNTSVRLAPWQSVLIPAASAEALLVPDGRTTASALVVRPQPDLEALRDAVAADGVPHDVSERFFAQFG